MGKGWASALYLSMPCPHVPQDAARSAGRVHIVTAWRGDGRRRSLATPSEEKGAGPRGAADPAGPRPVAASVQDGAHRRGIRWHRGVARCKAQPTLFSQVPACRAISQLGEARNTATPYATSSCASCRKRPRSASIGAQGACRRPLPHAPRRGLTMSFGNSPESKLRKLRLPDQRGHARVRLRDRPAISRCPCRCD